MSGEPFFSIGIPIYNVGKYIGEVLDSILSQSFTDFEVLRVLDGLSDNSEEVVRSYRQKDERVKALLKQNGGQSSAVNYSFYSARGKYIFSIDGDDFLYPGALKKAYDIAVKYNYPDVISASFIRVRGKAYDECPALPSMKPLPYDPENPVPADEEKEREEILVTPPPGVTKDENWINFYLDNNPVMQHSTKFVRREYSQQNGIFFSCRLHAQEDHDWSFEVCRKADSIVYSNFYAFLYNKGHEGSISTRWPKKAIYCGVSRWFDLFGDVEFMKIDRRTKQRFLHEKKEMDIVLQLRGFTMRLPSKRSKRECFELVDMIDMFFGRDIRKMPAYSWDTVKNRLVYLLYRVFGLKRGFKILYGINKLMGKTID